MDKIPILRDNLVVLRNSVLAVKNSPTSSDLIYTGNPTDSEQNTARAQYNAQLQTIISQIDGEIALVDRLTLQFQLLMVQAVALRDAIAAVKVCVALIFRPSF
jgi:hypothetical protein